MSGEADKGRNSVYVWSEESHDALSAILKFVYESPWQLTKANRQHLDEFGQVIQNGEEYYARYHGHRDCVRLTKDSYTRLLHILLGTSPHLREIGIRLSTNDISSVREAVSNMAKQRMHTWAPRKKAGTV